MLLGRAYSSKRGKPTFNKGILKSALTRLQGLQKRRVGKKIEEQSKNTCPFVCELYKPLAKYICMYVLYAQYVCMFGKMYLYQSVYLSSMYRDGVL